MFSIHLFFVAGYVTIILFHKTINSASLILQEKDPVARDNPDLHFNRAVVSLAHVNLYTIRFPSILVNSIFNLNDDTCQFYASYHSFTQFQAYKYEENYPQALAGFSRASQLDPSWPDPQTQEAHLLTFLSNVKELTQAKVIFSL